MLEKLEAGFCFYRAAGHEVSAWGPGPAKPAGLTTGWTRATDGQADPTRAVAVA
ncbi:uncharacterized protein METZ01_LOCUS426364, partial [marine metagenome]